MIPVPDGRHVAWPTSPNTSIGSKESNMETNGAGVARPGLHHIALTVTDLETSIPWYEQIFNIKFAMEVPHEDGTGMLLTDEGRSFVIVLHRHDANGGERFAETRT